MYFHIIKHHYSGVSGNENADFTRCAARKAMDKFEGMGRKCPFVSQPKTLPIGFRSPWVSETFSYEQQNSPMHSRVFAQHFSSFGRPCRLPHCKDILIRLYLYT